MLELKVKLNLVLCLIAAIEVLSEGLYIVIPFRQPD